MAVTRIYARSTELKEIGLAEALAFVETHHRAGSAVPGNNPKAYSLQYANEIVAVAIFCNPRTRGKQREYTTELFRLAFKTDVRVQGGASKLLKYYMNLPTSVDLFTYQDTSGEKTDIYAHSGMILVGEANPTKKLLVRDGITKETAQDNRRDWFSLEQASSYGPDALLGTTLGEVTEDGKRVSNIELFLRNGYHLEEVPGDRVYQWHHPDARFYTYRITAFGSDGYYYGRHGTQAQSPEEMLADGYMGSGGTKYQNWVNSVGRDSLKKEILGIYTRWSDSVAAEEKLIGDLHKTDPRCKNSKPGGVGLGGGFHVKHELKDCPIHGETLHMGNSCKKCSFSKIISLEFCPTHGEVTHYSGKCHRCSISKTVTTIVCPIHGETLHMGNSCKKCSVAKAFKEKDCPVHGSTLFQGDSCLKCNAEDRISTKDCPSHGASVHYGEICAKCSMEKVYSKRECPIHGVTVHAGSTCKTCVVVEAVAIRLCPIHGETKHNGEKCRKCISAANTTVKTCSIHGEVSHQGDSCAVCVSRSRLSIQSCSIHGEVKFLGSSCATCVSLKGVNVKLCPTHGETKHIGDVCKKCAAAKVWTTEDCPTHGESKHRSGKCVKCAVAAKKRVTQA